VYFKVKAEVSYRLPNYGHLLGVLLAKKRDMRLCDVEELDADRGDAVEVTRPERPLEAERHALNNDRRGVSVWIDLGDSRQEQRIDTCGSREVCVPWLLARIRGQIGRVVELARVDEDRRDHVIAGAARGSKQGQVPLMQRAHRRNETDPRILPKSLELLAHLADGAENLHV
jgi:hypothetical protein